MLKLKLIDMLDVNVKILSFLIIIVISLNSEILESKIRRPEFNRTVKGNFSKCYNYKSIYKKGKYLKPVLETVYFFDTIGNLTQQQRLDPAGKILNIERFYYDASNNLIHTNDFKNDVIVSSRNFFYDKNDSLTERIEKSYRDNQLKTHHYKIFRDKKNNIIERFIDGTTSYFQYDALNRLVCSYECEPGDTLATIQFIKKYYQDAEEYYYYDESQKNTATEFIYYKNNKKYFSKNNNQHFTEITYYDSLENEIEVFEKRTEDSSFYERCIDYKYDSLGNIMEKYEYSGDKLKFFSIKRIEHENNLIFIDEVFLDDTSNFRTSIISDIDGKELIISWFYDNIQLHNRNIINYDEFGNMIENIFIDSNDKPEKKEIYIFEK